MAKQLQHHGFGARVEEVNALEAYLGSLPGHGHQNVRKPLLHTLNLADLMPLTSMWPGLEQHPCPYYPAGSPSQTRGQHLLGIHLPMLFLQGTRDALAELPQLQPLCEALGSRATLLLLQDADHSFHVPSRSGRTDAEIRNEMLNALASWIRRKLHGTAPDQP